MAELIAQGTRPDERWRRPLPENQSIILGRDEGTWAVPWDNFISRRHVQLTWHDGHLEVNRLPSAHNPVFVQGKEAASFRLKPGEWFVIGETTFAVSESQVSTAPEAPQLINERTFSAQELQRIQFHDAPRRMDVLSRLPDVISGAADDDELFVRLVNMLLAGIPRADGTAVVAVDPTDAGSEVQVLHWDRRLATGGDFHASQRLVLEAVRRRQETVLHVWGSTTKDSSGLTFTQGGNVDWAFCTPVRGDSCKGWGIYVTGRFGGDAAPTLPSDNVELGEDLKFTELVAAILSSLRQVRLLQRRQLSLSQFFSPAVLRSLSDGDPEVVLRPRETDVTVLFCDLRGFSRESEKHGKDLLALLERVSKALGVMTQHILDQGGVVGDFHGDAAMGFWGWPIAQPDAARRAGLAALGIRTLFEAAARRKDHPLSGFRAGIGIATGNAVAGKIGSTDQVKVTVFGPVVNLASRLEGMTKILRAPIILDETTAEFIKKQIPPEWGRCRRLAVVKPYGLDTPLAITELLPPASEYPVLNSEHLAAYEEAVDAFLAGDWAKAYELLHRVPPQDDVKDFLIEFIIQHKRTPPPDWDGVIPMQSKS